MNLPAWTSVHHPIVRRESILWNRVLRRWRWLWIPLLLLPFGCSALCGLLALPAALADNSLAGWLFTIGLTLFVGIWATQGFANFGLNLFLSIGAATLIARERESQNWAMLRLTILHIPEIVGAKLVALLRQARWPIAAVLILRVVATVTTTLGIGGFLYLSTATGDPSSELSPFLSPATFWPTVVVGGIALAAYFVIEMIAGMLYNCGVGLLASCFSRTTGTAVGITFVLHFVLWFFVLIPVQQFIIPAVLAIGLIMPSDAAAIIVPVASAIASFLLPLFFEAGVAGAAFALALNQAQRIVE